MTRARISLGAVFAFAIAGTVMLGACGETRKSIGEACLKSEDCLSGFCIESVCAAQPPILDGAPIETNDAGKEASSEASTDSGTPTDSGASSPDADAASDASGD